MTGEFGMLFDLAGSLAILGMLAVAYGTIRRGLPDPATAGTVLGVLFGLVAVLQMKTPFQPVDGLIVDMRNVPIVLAGAFLGLRGFLVCVLLATAARLQIGGIGASAGIAGMIVAGGMGGLWNAMTSHRPRGARSLVVLALMGSTHLASVVLLPPDLALWFLSNASPILIGLNLLAIPLVGCLLERERGLLPARTRLAEETVPAPGEPLPQSALGWAMAHSGAAGGLRGPVACILIHVRHRGLVARFCGMDVDWMMARGPGASLMDVMPEDGIVGWVATDLLLMSVPDMPDTSLSALGASIRWTMSDGPEPFAGAAPFRWRLDLEVRRYDALPPLAKVLADMGKCSRRMRRRAAPKIRMGRGILAPRMACPVPDESAQDLFATFDRLQQARITAGWDRERQARSESNDAPSWGKSRIAQI